MHLRASVSGDLRQLTRTVIDSVEKTEAVFADSETASVSRPERASVATEMTADLNTCASPVPIARLTLTRLAELRNHFG